MVTEVCHLSTHDELMSLPYDAVVEIKLKDALVKSTCAYKIAIIDSHEFRCSESNEAESSSYVKRYMPLLLKQQIEAASESSHTRFNFFETAKMKAQIETADAFSHTL